MTSIDAKLFAFTSTLQPVRRAWQQAAGGALGSTGLSTSLATTVLFASRLGAEVQQKTLAFEIGVNPAALVRTLDQGEAAGLLERRGRAGDRRSKLVALTPEGKRRAAEMEKSLSRLRKQLMAGVALADVEAATRLLRQFESNVLAHLDSDG